MSIEPWNTAAGGRAACEDMPRKSIAKKLTDNPVQQKRGRLRPFPAIRRGRVRAEPANGSRDESLVGFGATPQGLKNTNICNFRGSFEPIFLTQFFHRLFDTTFPLSHAGLRRTKWASPRQLPYPSILRGLDTLLRRMFPRASVRIKFLFHRKGIFFITSQRQGLSYEMKKTTPPVF